MIRILLVAMMLHFFSIHVCSVMVMVRGYIYGLTVPILVYMGMFLYSFFFLHLACGEISEFGILYNLQVVHSSMEVPWNQSLISPTADQEAQW